MSPAFTLMPIRKLMAFMSPFVKRGPSHMPSLLPLYDRIRQDIHDSIRARGLHRRLSVRVEASRKRLLPREPQSARQRSESAWPGLPLSFRVRPQLFSRAYVVVLFESHQYDPLGLSLSKRPSKEDAQAENVHPSVETLVREAAVTVVAVPDADVLIQRLHGDGVLVRPVLRHVLLVIGSLVDGEVEVEAGLPEDLVLRDFAANVEVEAGEVGVVMVVDALAVRNLVEPVVDDLGPGELEVDLLAVAEVGVGAV
ncbi:hypothetical protein BDK51DRAFT_39657 [Blyttiomyces helicus]|uniref:Uncharacterized protein n=1 Tax=Blyttiomyces helicus TaxID=388810 RepID=A0A4P9WAS4_9FUNG|nr:hypothetical protein BDK51DRAFT_39657 [Blyttiomyces helicus]|eukprot:RKO88623.1 hypothetical protein BDK51DRAFT_39657 [Blyttiomyces helicus]